MLKISMHNFLVFLFFVNVFYVYLFFFNPFGKLKTGAPSSSDFSSFFYQSRRKVHADAHSTQSNSTSTPYSPPKKKKTLVAFVLGTTVSPLVDKVINNFGFTSFDYICFFHSHHKEWVHYKWFKRVTVISAHSQMKFWFFKRFLTNTLASQYEFVFLLDNDADLPFNKDFFFNVQSYLSILRQYHLLLSQPAVLRVGRSSDHEVCRWQPNSILRFTGFVEGGPFVSVDGMIWPLLYDLMQYDLVTGYGLDVAWCPFIHQYANVQHACGVVDALPVIHGNTATARGKFVAFDSRARREWDLYTKRFSSTFSFRKTYTGKKISYT